MSVSGHTVIIEKYNVLLCVRFPHSLSKSQSPEAFVILLMLTHAVMYPSVSYILMLPYYPAITVLKLTSQKTQCRVIWQAATPSGGFGLLSKSRATKRTPKDPKIGELAAMIGSRGLKGELRMEPIRDLAVWIRTAFRDLLLQGVK